MTLARSILLLTGLGFLGFGTAFTFWTVPMAGLVDISLPSATARIDFAATYGGFELGVGAFLVACVRRRDWTDAGLWAGALALGGFAAVRMLTLLSVGEPARTPIYIALILELVGVLLNLWGITLWRRSARLSR